MYEDDEGSLCTLSRTISKCKGSNDRFGMWRNRTQSTSNVVRRLKRDVPFYLGLLCGRYTREARQLFPRKGSWRLPPHKHRSHGHCWQQQGQGTRGPVSTHRKEVSLFPSSSFFILTFPCSLCDLASWLSEVGHVSIPIAQADERTPIVRQSKWSRN